MMLDLPSAKRLKNYLRNYTSEPHLAGTESDKRQAEWTREKLNEFGIPNAKIETYWPLLNYPISRRLAIVSGPEYLRYNASLKEERVEEDESTSNPDIVPLFHGRRFIQLKRIDYLHLSTYIVIRILKKWYCKRSCDLC